RLERDATQEIENRHPAPPAELVPQRVSQKRGHDRHQEDEGEAQALRSGQGTGGEKQGDCRDGQAELLRRHPREQDRVAVAQDEIEGLAQARSNTRTSAQGCAAASACLPMAPDFGGSAPAIVSLVSSLTAAPSPATSGRPLSLPAP